jgi:hypothetical protein
VRSCGVADAARPQFVGRANRYLDVVLRYYHTAAPTSRGASRRRGDGDVHGGGWNCWPRRREQAGIHRGEGARRGGGTPRAPRGPAPRHSVLGGSRRGQMDARVVGVREGVIPAGDQGSTEEGQVAACCDGGPESGTWCLRARVSVDPALIEGSMSNCPTYGPSATAARAPRTVSFTSRVPEVLAEDPALIDARGRAGLASHHSAEPVEVGEP